MGAPLLTNKTVSDDTGIKDHLKDIAAYNFWEAPVQFYCYWKQLIMHTQKLLRLRREERLQWYYASNPGKLFSRDDSEITTAKWIHGTDNALWCISLCL